MTGNMVQSVLVNDGCITVDSTPYDINSHVIVCNGVVMEPDNVVNWFTAALKSGKVFLIQESLRNATVELSQE